MEPIQPERVPEHDRDETGPSEALAAADEELLSGETARLLRLQQPFTGLGSRVGRDRSADAGEG